MSEPFLGQISLAAFAFPPRGYALCNGALLPIAQNQALFSLLGTQFGGDGHVNFALPDLRGRALVGIGAEYVVGSRNGQERVALTQTTMPPHHHDLQATADVGDKYPPTDNLVSTVGAGNSPPPDMKVYRQQGWTADTTLHAGSVEDAGGGQTHENMQPYAVLNFFIAISQAIYPPFQE